MTPGDRPCYIIGHKNPDTDAICSAIGYAEYLRKTRMPEAQPARCGDVNARTAWVLEMASVAMPKLLMDVRPTAMTICETDVTLAHEDETFLDVYQRMIDQNYRSIPVVNAEGQVVGMPSLRDLVGLLLPDTGGSAEVRSRARLVRSSLTNITRALGGRLENPVKPDEEQDFVMAVAASSWETLRDRTMQFPTEQLILIVGDRPSLQRLGIDERIRALVLTGGFQLMPEDLRRAKENDVAVLYSDHDTATTTQLIRCSRRVGSRQFEEFLSVSPNGLLSHISRKVAGSHQALFPVVDEKSGKLLGVLSKSDLLNPPKQRLVLVDHNEFSQAVKGAEEAEILEVIDHHRLSGNLITKEPVRFINEPLGSTSTIVARMFRQSAINPDPGTAICLCAGIISDTLHLTSPTTTDVDREMLPWLAKLASIDHEDFARKFFTAGSVLNLLPADKALESDRKEYEENGFRISISQIEELGLGQFHKQRETLAAELETLRHREGMDFACLMVTDITQNNSLLMVSGDRRISDKIEYPQLGPELFQLDGVVSRKKQLFPALGRVLATLSPGPEPDAEAQTRPAASDRVKVG